MNNYFNSHLLMFKQWCSNNKQSCWFYICKLLFSYLKTIKTICNQSLISLNNNFTQSSRTQNILTLKPLSHQTAMPQRLYSVLKPCYHAVGSPRNMPKNIKFASYSMYTTSSQRPYSVQITFPVSLQRPWRFQSVQGSCCSMFTARSRRPHTVLTARIFF